MTMSVTLTFVIAIALASEGSCQNVGCQSLATQLIASKSLSSGRNLVSQCFNDLRAHKVAFKDVFSGVRFREISKAAVDSGVVTLAGSLLLINQVQNNIECTKLFGKASILQMECLELQRSADALKELADQILSTATWVSCDSLDYVDKELDRIHKGVDGLQHALDEHLDQSATRKLASLFGLVGGTAVAVPAGLQIAGNLAAMGLVGAAAPWVPLVGLGAGAFSAGLGAIDIGRLWAVDSELIRDIGHCAASKISLEEVRRQLTSHRLRHWCVPAWAWWVVPLVLLNVGAISYFLYQRAGHPDPGHPGPGEKGAVIYNLALGRVSYADIAGCAQSGLDAAHSSMLKVLEVWLRRDCFGAAIDVNVFKANSISINGVNDYWQMEEKSGRLRPMGDDEQVEQAYKKKTKDKMNKVWGPGDEECAEAFRKLRHFLAGKSWGTYDVPAELHAQIQAAQERHNEKYAPEVPDEDMHAQSANADGPCVR